MPCIRRPPNISVQIELENDPNGSNAFSAHSPANLSPERLEGPPGAAEQKQTLPPYSLIMRLLKWFGSRRMAGDSLMQAYRVNAEKCLELAQTFNDRERRLVMLGMANAWLTLAEQHLRNGETVLADEPPTPVNEPPVQRSDSAGQDDPVRSWFRGSADKSTG
jgi:hypothetical protein